jgi:hypothetical protein
MTDKACQARTGSKRSVCSNKSYKAVKQDFGWCQLGDNVNSLINGNAFVQFEYATNGQFFFEVSSGLCPSRATPAGSSAPPQITDGRTHRAPCSTPQFFKQQRGEPFRFSPIFRCNSTKTVVTEDPKTGQVRYQSPDLRCGLTCVVGGSDRICSSFLESIIGQVCICVHRHAALSLFFVVARGARWGA